MPTIVTSMRLGRQDRARVSPTCEVAVLGGAPVDDDLVGGLRGRPSARWYGLSVVVGRPSWRRGRRTVAAERLAVLADELAEARTRRARRRRRRRPAATWSTSDSSSGAAGGSLADVDGAEAADHDVGAGVGVGEEVVEGCLHGVAEDERAGQEGDAEDDGEEGGDEARLWAQQVLEGDGVNMLSLRMPSCGRAPARRSGAGICVDDPAVGEEQRRGRRRRRRRGRG